MIAATSAGGTQADAAIAAGKSTAATSDVPRESNVAAVTSAAPISNVQCPESTFEPEPGTACGELHCLAFSSEGAAFAHVLELQPRVLGIGESHAQKGSETIHSATRRFAQGLLPVLCGRAKSIILEIWLPRNDCGDKRVEQVQKAQKPVTSSQAKTNQDEYVTLGRIAKRLGIAPSALVPTCDEYQSILDAGPDTIERMLQLIGKRTGERIVEELKRLPNQASGPVVIAYGGALHNDAEPAPDHAGYSYGPMLLEQTQGSYVELDLVVPEFVKDTDVWRRQPWYSAFKNNRDRSRSTLYQWAPHSFALVFPASTSR